MFEIHYEYEVVNVVDIMEWVPPDIWSNAQDGRDCVLLPKSGYYIATYENYVLR